MTSLDEVSLEVAVVSREELLLWINPHAAMYVLEITLIFSMGLPSNSLSNRS
jgi:hypothetical protein